MSGRIGPARSIFALGAVLAIAAAPTAAAGADTADDAYVNGLNAQGITVPRDQLISAGHTICSSASAVGPHLPARLTRLLPLSYTTMMLGLSSDQAQAVVDAALSTYCPQYAQ